MSYDYEQSKDRKPQYAKSYEEERADAVQKKYYVTTPDLLNVRVGPSTQDSIVCTVNRGTRIVAIENPSGDWQKIRILDGTNRTGFVMHKFLKEG